MIQDEEEVGPLLSIVGLVTAGSYVLLIKHAVRGAWEMPGGKMRRGETLRAALRREILEEAGVDINKLRIDVAPLPNAEQNTALTVVALIYHVHVDTGSMPGISRRNMLPTPTAGSDAVDARWYHLDEIPWNDLSEVMSKSIVRAWFEEETR